MKCQNCGTENQEGAVYCSKCGKKLVITYKSVTASIIIAVVIALAVGIFAGFIVFKCFDKKNDSASSDIETTESQEEIETAIAPVPSSEVVEIPTVKPTVPMATVPPTTAPLATVPPTTVPMATVPPMTTVQATTQAAVPIQSLPITPGGNVIVPTAAPTEVNPTATADKDLFISSTEKTKEQYEDDDGNTCTVTLMRPIVGGKDSDEVANFNDGISEMIDNISSDLESLVAESSTKYKTITFSKCEMTTLSRSRARITITGKMTPKSGSSKEIRYRINFDRESSSCTYEKS